LVRLGPPPPLTPFALTESFMIAIIGLLYLHLGWYAFICLGVLVLSIPLDIILGGKVGPYKDEAQTSTDSRVKLTRELISAIRIVKSYAWERPFERNLKKNRDEEVKLILGSHKILAGLLFVITNVPNIGIGTKDSLIFKKILTNFFCV